MFPSARQAIACVLFIFIAAASSQSQVAPAKNSTATISGTVTLKTKGLAGVVVAVRYADNSGVDRSRIRGTTDQAGKYRITNVPAGTYRVAPLVPGLVLENQLFEKSLVVGEGDNVEDVNFSMIRGGVITGKITDADDRPLVEEQIFLQPVEGPYADTPYYNSGIITDDRGVYRAFGLRAGKYKVYVGQGDNHLPGGSRLYRQTFYPSVTDAAKATVIEVTEGSETNDIDITMGRPFTAFKVSGKIVDDTGKPVPNVGYGIFQSTGEGSSQSSSGSRANANGEFKFEGVIPGKYSVFVEPDQNTEVRAEPVAFEVIDHDVTGLVVKTVRGSSVSGVVVLDGVDDPAAIAKIGNLFVYAATEPSPGRVVQQTSSGAVGPDGAFRVGGLSSGVVHFGLGVHNFGLRHEQLAIVRFERDGVQQPNRISIKDGEQVTGVRLIIKTLNAIIRGQVKIEDGELPPNAHFRIWLQPVNQGDTSFPVMYMNSDPQIDSRGRFSIERVAGGTYEINIGVFEPGRIDTSRIFKQQVTVADNSVSEVTVTIKLKP
jgi:hypothetical protein